MTGFWAESANEMG